MAFITLLEWITEDCIGPYGRQLPEISCEDNVNTTKWSPVTAVAGVGMAAACPAQVGVEKSEQSGRRSADLVNDQEAHADGFEGEIVDITVCILGLNFTTRICRIHRDGAPTVYCCSSDQCRHGVLRRQALEV